MKPYFLIFAILLLAFQANAQPKLRIAAYGGEIPQSLIKQFELKTGIKVYLSTFESNENLLLKLKSSSKPIYDVITPSNYYVERFKQFGMLQAIPVKKISNLKNINPVFLPKSQDKLYGLPFVWGATGIFYNKKYINNPPTHWNDFWELRFINQLLLLDDTREVFSIALLALGQDPNTKNAKQINNSFQKLKALDKNIKLFASDAVPSIIIDEDALVGMAWNGDIEKARQENPNIEFIFPDEGYIIWAECFAIPKDAEHSNEAIQFINFMLEAKNAAEITKIMKFPVTNILVKQYLPKTLANNKLLFPDETTLRQGLMQQDAPENIIKLYNKNWELLKLSL
jgi:spermidine/putrescine transport system substrate-binding protein